MDLAERLEERRAELEEAILVRVYGVADPTGVGDPAYVSGLRAAVCAAVSYGLGAGEESAAPAPEVPDALIFQARQAARNGVGLDTVLRRYFAGYMLIGDFLIAVAQDGSGDREEELRTFWRALASRFDHLIEAVAAEHRDESAGAARNAEERRAERVRRLLAGELVEGPDLGYELDAWHLGAIVVGPGARVGIRNLARTLDRQLLAVPARAGTIWAWLGGQREIDPADVLRAAEREWPPELMLILGEPGAGIRGWRLSHRQARAAVPIALSKDSSPVRYTDVALLASVLADDLLAESLKTTYLIPLEGGRDGGVSLRQTLNAYFAAGRNVTSAAAALGTSRRTVANRLATAEARIGRPLDACAADLETALRLAEMETERVPNREAQ